MRSALLLRVDPVDTETWRWLRLDVEGKPLGGLRAGTLADAAAEAVGIKVVVLAPGIDCLLASAKIPGRNRQKLMRAVPYALEEQVADEVENLHFALGPALEDGVWSVAALQRQYMDALLAAAVGAGLDVQQVIPEQLAIPFSEGGISVVIEGEVALVRTGRQAGYAIDKDNLGPLLAASVGEEEESPALKLYVQQDSTLPDLQAWPGDVQTETFAGDPLQLYAQGLEVDAINLLQGDYSRTGEWGRVLKPWRATAALLLAGVIVSHVVMAVDYFRLSKESEALQARIEQTYREAFPNARRIVNPRAQMQQQLDQLQKTGAGSNRFLVLVGKSGKVLRGTKGIEITSANFRAGRLDVDLTATDLQLLDKLKQDLVQAGGLAVEIQSAAAGPDKRVKGRLRIQGVES